LSKVVLAVVVALLLCVSARLVWSGSGLNIFSAIVLVAALGITASGIMPLVLETLLYLTHIWLSGILALLAVNKRTANAASRSNPQDASPLGHSVASSQPAARPPVVSAMTWLMPAAAAIVFGAIFVFANPDLLSSVWSRFTSAMDFAWNWIEGLSVWEIPFCLTMLFIGAGLLRPLMFVSRLGPTDNGIQPDGSQTSPLYAPFRNTLLTLIVLFGVYLLFEFSTLWRREFPDGFYYAGYAHQGAAWLTFALALATGLLSFVFSGQVLQDPRLTRLRKLTWIWSALNLLLAVAVYNRLMIYVGFNGMTRMRTVGFFGITLVVIGFLLVLVKIRDHRGFWWLIRAQLIALLLTVIGYGLFPVDWVANRYNAARIRTGYVHPSVMIAVKPIDDEGMLPLIRLVDVDDEIIREGIKAILAQRQREIESDSTSQPWHWTKYQGSTATLYRQMAPNASKWERYWKSPQARRDAINKFQDYAMQWY
jgi:hypothetical protein